MSYHPIAGTRFIVKATNTIGTDLWSLEVLEPHDDHSSLHFVEGVLYGAITSRPIPADLTEMAPGSPERIAAAAAHRDDVEVASVMAILARFPNLRDSGATQVRDGRVEVAGFDPRVTECGLCGTEVEVSDAGSTWCGSAECRRELVREAMHELIG